MVSDKSEVWETGQKSLHFVTAQETASSSNSMIVHCISASDRNLEPAWMRNQMSPAFCRRTNPRFIAVPRCVGLVGLKYERLGADMRDSFAAVKALSDSADHMILRAKEGM